MFLEVVEKCSPEGSITRHFGGDCGDRAVPQGTAHARPMCTPSRPGWTRLSRGLRDTATAILYEPPPWPWPRPFRGALLGRFRAEGISMRYALLMAALLAFAAATPNAALGLRRRHLRQHQSRRLDALRRSRREPAVWRHGDGHGQHHGGSERAVWQRRRFGVHQLVAVVVGTRGPALAGAAHARQDTKRISMRYAFRLRRRCWPPPR